MTKEDVILAQLSAAQLLGEAHSFAVRVTDKGARLESHPCRLVKLELWDTDVDFQSAVVDPVWWGFDQHYAHRIAPGGNTELLPLKNTGLIWVRCAPAGGAIPYTGAATLFVTFFK